MKMERNQNRRTEDDSTSPNPAVRNEVDSDQMRIKSWVVFYMLSFEKQV